VSMLGKLKSNSCSSLTSNDRQTTGDPIVRY
jgi:hypothetical protein